MDSSIAYTLGYGSGIDTVKLVSDLVNSSRAPKMEALNGRVSANQAKISALAKLTGELEAFTSSLGDVVREGKFRTSPTVSDSTIMSAKLSGKGSIGDLSAQVTVHRLAAGQTLYSGVKAAAGDPIGQGTLTLSVGGVDHAIVIDAGNDSLNGLAAAINNSGAGVTANLVNDGGGVRLVLKGQTGLDNAFTLAADAGADPGLSDFTFDGTTGGMTVGQNAADAQLEVDGLMLTRASNNVSDVIPGVELTLLKADPGKAVALGTERQGTLLKSTLQDFVSVYNTVWNSLKSARNEFGSEYALRQFEQQFSGLTTQKLTAHGSINKLSDVGIFTNRDGTIALNGDRFDAAIAADADAVEALFNPSRAPGVDVAANPGISGVLDQLKKSMLDKDGTLDAIKDRLTDISEDYAKELDRIESRSDAYRERLEKQFSAMDARVASLKATQSYLEQQIKIWNGNN